MWRSGTSSSVRRWLAGTSEPAIGRLWGVFETFGEHPFPRRGSTGWRGRVANRAALIVVILAGLLVVGNPTVRCWVTPWNMGIRTPGSSGDPLYDAQLRRAGPLRQSVGGSRTRRSARRPRGREHEDVEQFGASRRRKGLEASSEPRLHLVESHEADANAWRRPSINRPSLAPCLTAERW